MLELVFTVCSIVQGAHCHSLQPVRLDENTMMIACVMASQFEGARWARRIQTIILRAPRADLLTNSLIFEPLVFQHETETSTAC